MMSSLSSRSAWHDRDLQREIQEVFGALIDGPWGRGAPGLTAWPATDLFETEDDYLLFADLPGVAPDDVELRLEGRCLILCGLRWTTAFMRQGREVSVERTCGRFCRRIRLEEPVDLDGVQHGYENGIYWARLPKRRPGTTGDREPSA